MLPLSELRSTTFEPGRGKEGGVAVLVTRAAARSMGGRWRGFCTWRLRRRRRAAASVSVAKQPAVIVAVEREVVECVEG